MNTFKKIEEVDEKKLKTQWTMQGRSPEWYVSINDQRFHGSFPGKYEGHVVEWIVQQDDDTITLNTKNKLISILVTKEQCNVADEDYPYVSEIKVRQETYKGCAKHRI